MGGFISSLFGGASKDQKNAVGDMSGIADSATKTGIGDVGASSDFWKSILSGDPAQTSKVLAPQIGAIKDQAQQQKKTSAEFGNRGGGTNAGMQMADDNTQKAIQGLTADLTTKAAGELGALGTSQMGIGERAAGDEFGAASALEKQKADAMKALGSDVGSVAGFFL